MNWPAVVREQLWRRLLALGFSEEEISARLGPRPVVRLD